MGKWRGLSVSVVAAVSLVALPTTAAAEAIITGTGTFGITSDTVISTTNADGNVITVEELGGTLTGVLSGTFVLDDTVIVHPSGAFDRHGTFSFAGSVAGVGSGTLTEELTDHGSSSGVSGQVTVLSGTGDLSGLHGVTFFSSPPPTYSVMFVMP